MPPHEERKSIYARELARDLSKYFDLGAWWALARLTGDPFPFETAEKIDLLQRIREDRLAVKKMGGSGS